MLCACLRQVEKPLPQRLVVSELEMAGDSQFVTAAAVTKEAQQVSASLVGVSILHCCLGCLSTVYTRLEVKCAPEMQLLLPSP